jgi:hypothetical protein
MRDIFATAVYLLCLATSAGCGWLLVRSYVRTGARLLLWTAICFVMLTLTNLLVVVDLVFLPQIDLRLARVGSSLIGVTILLYGFIWELD